MHEEILDAVGEVDEDKSLKVLVITGSRDSFSAGMDLDKELSPYSNNPKEFLKRNELALRWLTSLRKSRLITIASVNGWCLGGGMSILGACDLAIASKRAVFGLPEIDIKLVPGGGAMWAVAYYLLPRRAMYFALTGDRFTAYQALEFGLINKVVSHIKLRKETLELAKTIAQKDSTALEITKHFCQKMIPQDLDLSLSTERAAIRELFTRQIGRT